MLRAIHRVLRPGGRVAFHTIEPAPGLTAAEKRRVVIAGPPGVSVRTSYPSLLATAGFHDVQMRDLTSEYRTAKARWLAATTHHESDLRDIIGDEEYENRIAAYRKTQEALDEGILRRSLYAATR